MVKILLHVLTALLVSPALNGSDDSEFYRDFEWHIEGATYAAFIEIIDGRTAEFSEIVGKRRYDELFSRGSLGAMGLKAGDSIVLFLYDDHLKQISFGNRDPRYTSRIIYRSVSLDDLRFFTRWNHKSVSELRKLLESKYHLEPIMKSSGER